MQTRDQAGASTLDKLAGRLMESPNLLRDLDLTQYMDGKSRHNVRPATDYKLAVRDLIVGRAEGDTHATRLPFNHLRGKFEFRRNELTIWTGYKGHGKALCVDTPIPTPEGWKLMGDLVVGDTVFDENGNHCKIVAATGVMHDRPCYRIVFSDGTSVIADEGHQWLTSNYKARTSECNSRKNGRHSRDVLPHGTDQSGKRILPSVVTTGEIANTLRVHVGTKAAALNHAVTAALPIAMPEAELEIDPYVLGAWLGDGNSGNAAITIADDEMLEQFSSRIGKFDVTKRASKYLYGITGGMNAILKNMGLLNNKHIPIKYLRGAYEQRIELMRGMLDTDGHIDKNGRVEFCNTNKRLADGVYELAQTLGIVPTLITGNATLYGKNCGLKYRVFFTTSLPVFAMPRKAAKLKPDVSVRNKRRFIVSCEQIDSVPVRCIQVDSQSHLFLASKAFIPTHNSLLISQVFNEAIRHGKRIFIFSPEFRPERVLERMLYQHAETTQPTREDLEEFMRYVTERVWLYDTQGSLSAKEVIALCRYVAETITVDHILIDSLMKCGMAPDDYAGQKQFVDQVQVVAHSYPLHLHLVAHAKKANDDSKPARLHDVKGASEIADMAENVLSVWRNKEKEKTPEKRGDEPDASLTVEAQRNGDGWIGNCNLMFNRESMNFYQLGDEYVRW